MGFVSAERVGQGKVGGITRRVLCSWQLLGLAVKGPWLAPGGTTLTLGCMNWLRKHYSCRAKKAAWALSGCLLAENATIACSLMNIGMVRL